MPTGTLLQMLLRRKKIPVLPVAVRPLKKLHP